MLATNRLGLPHSAALVSEVATLNQKKTVDERFWRIEFEGRFVVAHTQWPLINGMPTDVDGAVRSPTIATNERLSSFNEKMAVLTCATSVV